MNGDLPYREKLDQASAQLAALRAGPGGRRRRFRLLEWVCAGCGRPVLEVYATHPHWVIVTWEREHSTAVETAVLEELSAEGMHYDFRMAAWQEARRRRRRRGPAMLYLLVETPSQAPTTVPDLTSTCHCRIHQLAGDIVLEDLLTGTRRRTV